MCFLQKHYEAHKSNQTDTAHLVSSHRNKNDLFP